MIAPFRYRPLTLALALLACLPHLAGCGAGTAALVSGADDEGSGPSPALSAFSVPNPKVSPAVLRLEASAGVSARLSYVIAGAPEAPMSALSGPGVSGGEVTLPSGASELTWDFASDLGSGEYEPDVDLFVRHPNGTLVTGGSLRLGVGNDPPVVLSVEPMPTDPADPSESSGNVEVRLAVRDSSADVVAIDVAWRRASDPPDAWQPATAAGVFPAGIETEANDDGVSLSFFWNTNVDLPGGDDDVLLRVTADDGTLDAHGQPIGVSLPVVSALLRVDNNAEPIVQLLNDLVVASDDERRGIPVPLRVFDDEGDVVQVVLQWRRQHEEFPELPTADPAALAALLADPAQRREQQVCSEYPRFARGRLQPLDATSARLSELARGESWILASGITGRTLEILRPPATLAPIGPTWGANPLASPLVALPLGDGLTALVLDAPGNGRVSEIELATGAVVRTIATLGAGTPSAMALEGGGAAVLVATDLGGIWRLERVELATGERIEFAVSDGSELGPVRGLASLGTGSALFTAGSALFFLDYRDPAMPQLSRILTGLATPWGIVMDGERLYLAEREAVTASGTGRVLALELDTRARLPVVVRTEDLSPASLERPSALALEHGGARLLVVTSAGAGSQLVRLDLGASGENVALPVGAPRASEIAWIAAGADDLRLATLPGAGELLVGGGLEQRRTIVVYENAGSRVELDAAFAPQPGPDRRWRIRAGLRAFRADPAGTDATFLWNSTADVGGGPVVLRALALDAEAGIATEGRAPKRVLADFEAAPLVLGGQGSTPYPVFVAATDLDLDGDLDLVTANDDDRVTAFRQTSAGTFDPIPQVLAFGHGVVSLAIVDLDADGDADLALANRKGSHLAVHIQDASGTFALAQTLSVGSGLPRSIAAADLDGDGDLDLASANENFNALTVFFQDSPGHFDPAPLQLETGPSSNSLAIQPADLDGDGDLDLAFCGSRVGVFFQTGSGMFDPVPLVVAEADATTNGFMALTCADLDGDGDLDLATINQLTSSVWVHFQGDPGSFETVPLVLGSTELSGSSNYESLVAVDLDGDGDLDLVSSQAPHSFTGLTVFLQEAPGSFGPGLELRGRPEVVSGLEVADLDGDGRQDLVSSGFDAEAGTFGGFLSVALQDRPGGFTTVPHVLHDEAIFAWSLAAADLDGDGDQDVAVAEPNSGVWVYFQGTPGTFEPDRLLLDVGSPGVGLTMTVAAADLDGDGDVDLVSGDEAPTGVLSIFFQQAPRSFTSESLVLTPGVQASEVECADLDQDGDLDLVSANADLFSTIEPGNLTVYFQGPTGRFGPVPMVLGGAGITDRPLGMTVADLDGDGDPDLALAEAESHRLVLFHQDAPGSFVFAGLLGGPGITEGVYNVKASDIDGDGDQDLVSANAISSSLTVFFQLSQGFDPAPLVLPASVGFFLPSLAIADLDGDGDQDLAFASFGPEVLYQVSPGRFAPFALPSASGVRCIIPTDLDGDGDLDLLTGSGNTQDLRVFWGGR